MPNAACRTLNDDKLYPGISRSPLVLSSGDPSRRRDQRSAKNALEARGASPELTTTLDETAALSPANADALKACLTPLRILDPACGSGAFLVHLLERLTDLHVRSGARGTRATIKRRVLTQSIFGVDINPMAVWLCELRLWLSTVRHQGVPISSCRR